MKKIEKSERAIIFNKMMEKAGIPSWGRATRLCEAVGVSPATAAGWLGGSLPRDVISLISCGDKFDLDIYEWVEGVSRGKDVSNVRLEKSIKRLREHESDNDLSLSSDQFAKLAVMLYEDEEKAGYLLENVKLFLPS